MKILRVLRRRKIRLSFICILLLIFIVNSYAWIVYSRETETGALVATVSSWGVEFVIADEDEKVEEYTYEIEDFYPGIDPISKTIYVYNVGESASRIKYWISEIYLYGEPILTVEDVQGDKVVETLGEETIDGDGNKTANAFGNSEASIFNPDTYDDNYSFLLKHPTPFTISYTYNKDYIEGNGQETSRATMTLNLAWYNDEDNNEEDTKFGNLAYEYKNTNPDEPALKIVFKVKARRDGT